MDTDALVSELRDKARAWFSCGEDDPYSGDLVRDRIEWKAADAIARLTRESQAEAYLDVLINSPDPHWIDVSKRRDERAQRAADVIRDLRKRAETAEAALSAARAELALMSKQLSWCLHELRSMHFIRLVNDGMKVQFAEIRADSDIGQFRAHRHISAQPAAFDPSALKEAPHE